MSDRMGLSQQAIAGMEFLTDCEKWLRSQHRYMPFRVRVASVALLIIAKYGAPATLEQATYISRVIAEGAQTVKSKWRKHKTATTMAIIITTLETTKTVLNNWEKIKDEIDPNLLERQQQQAVNLGVYGEFMRIRNNND